MPKQIIAIQNISIPISAVGFKMFWRQINNNSLRGMLRVT